MFNIIHRGMLRKKMNFIILHIETLTLRNFRLLQAPLPVFTPRLCDLAVLSSLALFRFSVRNPVFNLAYVFLCSV
jgi:hypothetical protein